MSSTAPSTDAAERSRYLFIRLPRCPQCASTRLRAYKTIRMSTGTTMRYLQCANCGRKRIVGVYE